MLSTKALRKAYGNRIERVISESTDPLAAMDKIAFVAERRGLIDNSNGPRRSSPQEFVSDLWHHNPVILDRLELNRQRNQKEPSAVTELADVFDVLP